MFMGCNSKSNKRKEMYFKAALKIRLVLGTILRKTAFHHMFQLKEESGTDTAHPDWQDTSGYEDFFQQVVLNIHLTKPLPPRQDR